MRRDELVNALRATPFRPFRLRVSDGTTFDIRHLETLMVTRHSVIVGIAQRGDIGNSDDGYPRIERSTTVDLLHVAQIEELSHGPNPDSEA